FRSSADKLQPRVMPEPPQRGATSLFSSMLILGLDRNTCAAQLKRSRAVVPAAVRGWQLIVKFHSGVESFSAFLLLSISDSTSAPAPFSLPRARIFLPSVASTRDRKSTRLNSSHDQIS